MTAQESFNDFTKSTLAPMLRELGFKGSGQKYRFPDSDHFVQIGVQKSTYSDWNEIRFTINVQIVAVQEWVEAAQNRPHLPKEPSPNTGYGLGYQERIGLMRPENLDLWWKLSDKTDHAKLVQEIRAIVVAYVLPAIRQVLSPEAQQKLQPDAG